MSSFDRRMNIEDSINDGLIITAATTEIFFALEAANVKSSKASQDGMDTMNLVGETCRGVLEKDFERGVLVKDGYWCLQEIQKVQEGC